MHTGDGLPDADTIAPLRTPLSPPDLTDLATLLTEAVADGAAVSFLHPLSPAAAADYFRQLAAGLPARGTLLAARCAGRIVGCVVLAPAWAPNQQHRGEVMKLLVARDQRRRGLGARLMLAAEAAAGAAGLMLLTLDARADGAAHRLYLRLGWVHFGTVPDYAMDVDGRTPHAASFFYKRLDGAAAQRRQTQR